MEAEALPFGPDARGVDLELGPAVAERPDQRVQLDLLGDPAHYDRPLPLEVPGLFDRDVAQPDDRVDERGRRGPVRQQVGAEEDVDVVGRPGLGELDEEGPLVALGEVLPFQEQAEPAADGERDILVAELVEQVEQAGSQRVHRSSSAGAGSGEPVASSVILITAARSYHPIYFVVGGAGTVRMALRTWSAVSRSRLSPLDSSRNVWTGEAVRSSRRSK